MNPGKRRSSDPPRTRRSRSGQIPDWELGETVVAGRAEGIRGHDAKPIVIDEVLGALLTVACLGHTLAIAVVGFLLFRVLDVVNPPPASQPQPLSGGLGVMADDALVGVHGNLLLRMVDLVWTKII